jgi:crotonobetainyl-CoA:carnitine CoA-transferase CaiB-like acyl-CoA transferase
MSLPDPAAGIHTAVATLAALYRAQSSGEGERVEMSMLEASVSAFPWPVLYQGVEGHGVPVDGNRDEARAPHDVYRCAGHYEWVAIAVDDDRQFAALARAIGRPELAVDERFATLPARRRHADDLDEILSAWTAPQEAADAAALLRAVGVPAERVRKIDELVESAPLLARGFFVDHEHPTVGVRKLAGPAWWASRSPMTVAGPAPRLGQHSRAVLARWLGLGDDELDALDAADILR